MAQYLVVTKKRDYWVEADIYGTKDIQGGRKSIYTFFKNKNAELVATFDVGDVKAIMKQ